ncbi:MAG: hypothetical protein BWY37_01448 [Firmicutes bacterium ADurb.Bin262]|nr:MAG: hypothetical protein BWY37_01448 [Firmicutes bacterium ADurb.Bin262]
MAGMVALLFKKIAALAALIAALVCALQNPPGYGGKTLSEGNRIIMEKGIVLQAWVPSDTSGERCIPAGELKQLGFGPSYYEGSMFNAALHAAEPGFLWGLAQAPTGGGSSSFEPTGEEWMTPAQLQYADRLVSVCIGDENAYSDRQVLIFKQWFDDFRQRHPGVLMHSNQWCNQWTRKQMAEYMRVARPDLLTFDSYYFDIGANPTPDWKMGAVLADSINFVRVPAMAGWDGSGRQPIPFGQYLLGYKTGDSPPATGRYEITESQKRATANMTLTMGGKWLNLFRIIYNADMFLLFDSEGRPTRHFDEYAQINRETRNLSPHLVKLQTTDVRVVRGLHKALGIIADNVRPKTVRDFTPCAKYALDNIAVVNTGAENDGLSGDVYIGYFAALPGVSFESGKSRRYFAVCNALTSGNGLLPEQQHGSSAETAQQITLSVDAATGKNLYYVDALTGQTVPVETSTGEVAFTLGGGDMRLFFWE